MYNYYEGQFFKSEKTHDIVKVCHVNTPQHLIAVVELNALKKDNYNKPKVYKFGDFYTYCQKNHLSEYFGYSIHTALTSSDEFIEKEFGSNWIKARDKKWARASVICSQENVHKYLYGDGLGQEISEIMKYGDWQTPSAYIHAINRFIALGCTKNAFLPLGYSNCGMYDRINSNLRRTKTGCCGADNRNSRSKTRGVTSDDRKRIEECVADYLKNHKSFSWSNCFNFYQKENFSIINNTTSSVQALPENERISYGQFYYHARKLVNLDDIVKKHVGRISFEKDFTPRIGSERDNVLGATDRYEIDATILDVHIRFSLGAPMKLSAGRPVLYLVVDAYSAMIVGMHLAVGNSVNVSGVCQALVNACLPKTEFAARYGVNISENDWPANYIPRQLTTDNGREFPKVFNESVLRSGLGIEYVNKTQAYRGDRKASVERAFHSLNQSLIHFLPGAVLKKRDRTEADPTNAATYTYDELMALLIGEIIKLNQNSQSPQRLNHAAVRDGITPTRQEIFLHSLRTSMRGGRITTTELVPKVYWSCLPEEEATVRDNGVFLDGLTYHSELIQSMGFYKRALSNGRFKIRIKRIKDWTNVIWYQTDDGQIIQLDLVNVNNDSPYQRLSWDVVPLITDDIKDRMHQSDIASLGNSLRIDQLSMANLNANRKLEKSPNSPRSRQKHIKKLSQIEKTNQQNLSGNEINRVLTGNSTLKPQPKDSDNRQFLEDLYDN